MASDQQQTTGRQPPIKRDIRTNEDEARWLADTIQMRAQEAVGTLGIRVDMTSRDDGLYHLLLLSLNAATRRGKEQAP